MPASRLTKKHQATIPKEICTFLDLDSGDSVAFLIQNDEVVLRKSSGLDAEYARAIQSSLSEEWASKEDSELFNDL